MRGPRCSTRTDTPHRTPASRVSVHASHTTRAPHQSHQAHSCPVHAASVCSRAHPGPGPWLEEPDPGAPWLLCGVSAGAPRPALPTANSCPARLPSSVLWAWGSELTGNPGRRTDRRKTDKRVTAAETEAGPVQTEQQMLPLGQSPWGAAVGEGAGGGGGRRGMEGGAGRGRTRGRRGHEGRGS